MSLQELILSNVAQIREYAAQFLTDTCQVYRKTGEEVVAGESRPTYAAPVTIACRLIVRSGSESTNIAAQERIPALSQFTGLYRMQLPYGTDIREGDKIHFSDRVFDVTYSPPAHAMMGAFVIAVKESA